MTGTDNPQRSAEPPGPDASGAGAEARVRDLQPLTPAYDEAQHGAYVEYLKAALRRVHVRNVAITGGYGSGKSSVIAELMRSTDHQVLNVSIASLGDNKLPGDADPDGPEDLTNRIQKAIVKQLLYRMPPAKLPASNFHRVSRFQRARTTVTSAALVIGVGGALRLLGWDPDLAGSGRWEAVTAGGIAALATVGLTWLRSLMHQRFWITNVSAAGATVTLTPKPSSYFDKYLAEIIYFFEVTKWDVVVFEDLDRFENPGIFEALRELNTLLNNSEQVNRNIRFVYALRDSVFEKLGAQPTDDSEASPDDDSRTMPAEQRAVLTAAAEADIERANRTKFFDLVIPMVPFVTHRTARDLLTDQLDLAGESRPSSALVDLAARHVPDMRMLKNIANEFRVFVDVLIEQGKGAPELNVDTVLALVLYKHLHLGDFENIVHGRSDLDAIYQVYREVVNLSVADVDEDLRGLEDASAAEQLATARAEDLAPQLLATLRLITRDAPMRVGGGLTMQVGGQDFTEDALPTSAFWWSLLHAGEMTVKVPTRPGYAAQTVSLSLDDVQAVVGVSVSQDEWNAHDEEVLRQRILKHMRDRDFLRGASMKDLAARPEFTTRVDGQQARPFAQVVRETLRSPLAVGLVLDGWIDHNFSLYVGQFYGSRLTRNAQTFVFRNIDTNTSDTNYRLSTDEVDALLAEPGLGPSCLRGRSAYNVSIFDRLLATSDQRLETTLDRLSLFGEPERQFVEAYISGGAHPDELIRRLSSRWRDVLRFLISDARRGQQQRGKLVNAALLGLQPNLEYAVDEDVGRFFTSHYETLSAFTADNGGADAGAVITVAKVAGAWFADLRPLGPAVREAVIAADLYPVTAMNLRAALKTTDATLALDAVKQTDTRLYEDCLGAPGDYLDAVAEDDATPFTVNDCRSFEAILNEVAPLWDAEQTSSLISRASPDCLVEDLQTVPSSVWKQLAQHRRFPASFSNIAAYRDEHGIDSELGALLTAAGTITVNDQDEQPDLVAVAGSLLQAAQEIPRPADRVHLVESLRLSTPLAAAAVPVEAGDLVAQLLKAGLVAEDPQIFERYQGADWPTYEGAVAASPNFADFVSPGILPAEKLPALLNSAPIQAPVKEIIVQRIGEFAPSDDAVAWNAAGKFLASGQHSVTTDDLHRYAAANVTPDTLIALADRYLDLDGDPKQVLSALSSLGGDYAGLEGTPGQTLKLPYDVNRNLFHRLQRLGLVKQARQGTKRREKHLLMVTVA